MRPSPFLQADLLLAADRLRPLVSDAPSKEAFAAYATAVTAFTALESAFVPVGQTDTALRDEVRGLLAAEPVRPVADIFRHAVECHARVTLDADPSSITWTYLGALAPVEAFAADLGRAHARWLLATAYGALVVYGRPRAALPRCPAGLLIDVAFVPGTRARTRFVDEDDDEAAGVPVTACTWR